jgi:hypothetical protein
VTVSTGPRGTKESIYAYKTKRGTRYRFVYRDSAGRQSTVRGFTSRSAARGAREKLLGQVHRGQVRVSRATFGEYWQSWLARRRSLLEEGSWHDYRRHGELRLLPDQSASARCSPATISTSFGHGAPGARAPAFSILGGHVTGVEETAPM